MSFKYKASITGNTYNLGIGHAGYNTNKVGKNESWYSTKTLKQFLENFKHTID